MGRGRLLTITLGATGGALLARFIRPLTGPGVWVDEGVVSCAYPRTNRALAELSRRGVKTIINLHRRAHDPSRLGRHGLVEVHLPTADFKAPSQGQLARGVDTILKARAAGGGAVAVHCGGGLGRTGTLLACYLAHKKEIEAGEAIRRVRRLKPGSVETGAQARAVEAYARGDRRWTAGHKRG